MRKIEQIHERIVNLKSQPKWFTRILYIIIGLILLPISFVIVFAGYNAYTKDACDNYMSLNYNSNTTPPTDSCFIWQYNSHDGYEGVRRKYNITRKNHDGSTLLTSKCFCGGTPKYKGTTPTNGMDNCVFSGRSPAFRTINSDFTYTATFSCWWTIRYISGDTVLGTQNVNYGEKIKNPTILSEGQFISGAYLDPELTIPFDIYNTIITQDLDIYVVFGCNEHYHENGGFCAVDTYNINWRDQYGALLKTDVFNYGEKIKNPTILSEGQFISGAYLDPELTIPFDIYNTIITQDFDIYVVFGCNIGYHISGDSCEINQIRFRDGDVLIITQFGSVSPIGIDSFEKEGYVFLGLFLDENYSIPFDFQNTIVEGDLDLYAKYEICPEGYHTKNNQCVSDEAGIYYEDQYIKITDGVNTFYIKDRNQGATKVAMTGVVNTSGTVYNFNYTDDALATFGTYYCWGQNRGFTLSDLGINICNSYGSSYCNVTLDISEYGPGRIGDDDTGWEESSEFVNPCNADEGEYLPTVSDWYEALSIWGDIKGYEVDSGFNGSYGSFSSFSVENYNKMWEFFDDLLSPSAPAIKYGSNTMVYIQPSSFWTAMDNSGIVGVFSNYYWDASEYGGNVPLGSYYDIDYNNYAMPVRCFIDPDYLEGVVKYTVTFDMRGGNESITSQAIKEGKKLKEPAIPTKDGYTFAGWYTSDGKKWNFDEDVVESEMILYAKWRLCGTGFIIENNQCIPEGLENPAEILDVYVVNYETNGGNIIGDVNVIGGDTLILPTPTKDNYTFDGWYTDRALTNSFASTTPVTSDLTLYAKWSVNQSSSSNGGGGGGGGSSLKKDNCPNGDYSDSYYDGTCGKKKVIEDSSVMPQNDGKGSEDSPTKPQSNKTGHNSAADKVVYDTLKFNPHYSDEMNQAYQFAYHYGITTKNNIKDAAMNWELTRIAMAKMLSQYAVNVLGIKPDATRNNKFADVSDKLDIDYEDGVTLAYQLGIMGINMPNNEFLPYNYVTRAEFATALSRLLYHTSDGMFEKTSRYYVPHINKLAYEGILTNTDPTMKELRGYVMLMLMRSAK